MLVSSKGVKAMNTIKESDWKVFKRVKAFALDTYCQDILGEFQEIIVNEDQTAHEN